VGIGTPYRHFPTRDALIAETYRNEVAHVAEGADELLATLPADRAMEEWLERFIAYAAAKRGMGDALKQMAISREELFPAARRRIEETIDTLLRAGVEAGSIRPDVSADDVYRATMAIWNIPPGDAWVDQARVVLRLVMDGLRYGASRG
jgi:AcrR family transcriptional regulator